MSKRNRTTPIFRFEGDQPAVDWTEVERLELLAREAVTMKLAGVSKPREEKTEIVLGRSEANLVLLRRISSGRSLRLERAEITGTLDSGQARIQPFSQGIYTLQLQPADGSSIEWAVTQLARSGKWKSERSSGVPIYGTFDSADLAALHELRVRLIGQKMHDVLADQEARIVWPSPPPVHATMDDWYQAAMTAGREQGAEIPPIAQEWLQATQQLIDRVRSAVVDGGAFTDKLTRNVERYWETWDAYAQAAPTLRPGDCFLVYLQRSQYEMQMKVEMTRLKRTDKQLHDAIRAIIAPTSMSNTYKPRPGGK